MKQIFTTILFLCLAFGFAQNSTNIYAQLPDNSEWQVDYSPLSADNNSVSFPNNNSIHITTNNTSIGEIIIPNMDFSNITSSDSVYLSFDYEIAGTGSLPYIDAHLGIGDAVHDIFVNLGAGSGSEYINITPYVANQNDVDLTFFFNAESGNFIEINNLQISNNSQINYFPPFSADSIENSRPSSIEVIVNSSDNSVDITAGTGAENDTVTITSSFIDLSNLENPVLSIDYLINDETNASQTTLLISSDGGITFEEIPIIQGGTSGNENSFSINLSNYISDNTIIALQFIVNNGNTISINNTSITELTANDGDAVVISSNPRCGRPDCRESGTPIFYDCLPLNEPIHFSINYEVLGADCGSGLKNQEFFAITVSVFKNNESVWTMTISPNIIEEIAGNKWLHIGGTDNDLCACYDDNNNSPNNCAFYACEAGIYTLKITIMDDDDCADASIESNGIEFTQTLIAGCCEANGGNTLTYNNFNAIPNIVHAHNTITINATNTLSSSKIIVAGESVTMTSGEIAPNNYSGQNGTLLGIVHCEETDLEEGNPNPWNGGSEIMKNAEENEMISNSFIGDADFRIYPNPTNAIANIVYELEQDTKAGISIYNTLGQRVAQIEAYGEKEKGNYKISYDTSNLKAGIYYCTLESDNFVKSIKIVKIE